MRMMDDPAGFLRDLPLALTPQSPSRCEKMGNGALKIILIFLAFLASTPLLLGADHIKLFLRSLGINASAADKLAGSPVLPVLTQFAFTVLFVANKFYAAVGPLRDWGNCVKRLYDQQTGKK